MPRRIERWLLAIEGLASGVLTWWVSIHLANQLPNSLAAVLFGLVILWCLGLIFGVVIAAHVHLFRGVDSLSRLVGFVATCVVAYPAAFYSQRLTPFSPEFLNLSGTGPGVSDSSALLFPGFVGSAIVCAGVLLFLVSPGSLTLRQLATFLLKALGGSVVCGVLAVFAWAFGERVAIPAWAYNANLASDSLAYFALSAMVQMGAASLVGFLMPQEAMPVAPQPAARLGRLEPKAGWATQFAAAAALLILTYGTLTQFESIYVNTSERHDLAAQRRLAAEQAAERPPLNHLPAVVAPPVGQVLLLKDISGHPPGQHSVSFEGKRPGTVESVSYTVNYKRLGKTFENEPPFADVGVTIYPTPAWAVYWTKQLTRDTRESPGFDPKTVKTVNIMGNRVIRNAWYQSPNGRGPLYFYWTSGSRHVRVTFWVSEDDEFVKEYLARYPSTL